MSEELKQAINAFTSGRANVEGLYMTPITGLAMMRAAAPSGMRHAHYKPLICLVLCGAKHVVIGDAEFTFSAGQSLIVSLDRPIVGRIVKASQTEPYLALALELDMAVMREVMDQVPDLLTAETAATLHDPAFFLEETTEAVADCALRLVRLLRRPEAIPVLSTSIIKEMHYWLLAGRHGCTLRQLALPDSRTERVARAVAILRSEFANSIPVERLAAAAGMSPSSFHQHFKATTSLSPRQFQKQLRLLEARRLMLTEGASASHAAFEVGYESASQFTREYGRMFGTSPRRDASESREAA